MRIGGVNNMKKYKIAVAGTGYVGLSIATLLSQHHHETAVDIIPEKVEMINNRKSPIQDDYIEKYLAEKELNLTATKTAAHWIGKAKCGTYGIRFFWPLINTYGEEERSARLVNTIIRKVLHGESPDLSAGNQYYDFVHVSDVARALILIAEKGVDGTNYTIGSGDAKPLKEFLKIVGQVANDLHDGEPVELGFGKITSNVISLPITTFDVTKLYKDTGFKPLIPFRKGIERTARWIKEDEGM